MVCLVYFYVSDPCYLKKWTCKKEMLCIQSTKITRRGKNRTFLRPPPTFPPLLCLRQRLVPAAPGAKTTPALQEVTASNQLHEKLPRTKRSARNNAAISLSLLFFYLEGVPLVITWLKQPMSCKAERIQTQLEQRKRTGQISDFKKTTCGGISPLPPWGTWDHPLQS